MTYQIELRQLEAHPTVTIREQVARDKLGEVLPQRITEIEAFIAGRRGQGVGAPFARFHNYGEVERTDVDLEIGVPTSEVVDCPAESAYTAGSLPGGTAATLRYDGPYEAIEQAYEQLQAWIREREYESAGAPWESYRGDLESDAWEVELVWPLTEI
ncbi:MAG: GyrI-like domain-containing protein [Anaerolineae bacterium]|nr:GyrI-like domain-containing protein [Anaerolineae bacterium]